AAAAAAAHPRVLARSRSGPLLPSSSPWTLPRSATPFTTAAAFRSKLHRARAIAGGSAQALADAVRWEPKRVYGGEAAGPGGGEKFLNLPNLVSIGRMASGPLIGWMIMNEWYLPAFGTLALSGASDWVRLHPYNISTILTPYVKNLTHHFFSDNSWMVF
uniref:Uncharacterized protein n=1 Tax=Aegilops tauschii subsp. strangulata TaxID=200361 RepID=A0A453FQ83_AEGTS